MQVTNLFPLPPKELHPSLEGGYALIYENVVSIDMRYIDYDRNINHLGSHEAVLFKLYTANTKPNITRFKMEIESEHDPFFSASLECDETQFSLLKHEQKLRVDFQELPTIVIKCLNRIEQAKGQLNAGLLVQADGNSKLTLSHTSEFKNIEVLCFELRQETEEKLERIIKHKYSQLRESIRAAESRLARINEVVKEKNPSLLLQIHKAKK